MAVDYFKSRGHDHIKVFVPEWRKEQSRPDALITDQHILAALEKENILVYTPSRKVSGKRIVCYDDRYIVRYAYMEGGVIVSNDQYRDLMQENPEWRKVIEERLLQFIFANDHFMPPDDPLGKSGPTLDQLLCKDPRELLKIPKKGLTDPQNSSQKVCPHLGNCTFGRKCKYYHPDREPQQQQKAEIGGGSSGGSYTPSTTSSRSATSSPCPDSRGSQGGGGGAGGGGGGGAGGLHSNKNSREDLYNHFSRHSSSDDLQRVLSSGEVLSPYQGGGSSPYSPATVAAGGTIDISELSKRLGPHTQTSPTKGTTSAYPPDPAYQHHNHHHHHHAHTGPHLSIKFAEGAPGHIRSAPIVETTPTGLTLVDGRPHNHTFPLTQVRPNVRSTNSTEDHTSYHAHPFNNRAGPDPSSTLTFAPREGGVMLPNGTFQLPPTLQSRMQEPGGQYLAAPPPQQQYGGQGVGQIMVDPATLIHRSPIAPPPSAPGVRKVGVVPTPAYPAPHPSMGVAGGDQSIPLHSLHQQHFSPNHQPRPPYAHALPPPANLPPQHSTNYHHIGGEGFSPPDPRLELFRTGLSVLPGCEDRIGRMMQRHPELMSRSDVQRLVELVRRSD